MKSGTWCKKLFGFSSRLSSYLNWICSENILVKKVFLQDNVHWWNKLCTGAYHSKAFWFSLTSIMELWFNSAWCLSWLNCVEEVVSDAAKSLSAHLMLSCQPSHSWIWPVVLFHWVDSIFTQHKAWLHSHAHRTCWTNVHHVLLFLSICSKTTAVGIFHI